MVSSHSSDTLEPLPPVLRHGLVGVAIPATISLLSTLALFTHLTYKLIRYSVNRVRRKTWTRLRETRLERNRSLDLSLGLDEQHFGALRRRLRSPTTTGIGLGLDAREYPPPNQFVVLLYNLLLADIQQAVAFSLNVVWVASDGIYVHTPACWAQGFFISNGDLASSCFIASIALHTYLTVVRDYKPPERILNAWIVSVWIVVYGITFAGIASTGNGKDAGGYFVRATAWCWINEEFDNLRLTTHYLYIFLALVATPIVYFAVFLHLRARSKMKGSTDIYTRRPVRRKGSLMSLLGGSSSPGGRAGRRRRRRGSSLSAAGAGPAIRFDHHPAFLVYPLIYVVCTLPLALGRVGTLAGADVPPWYFCAAGALIASNGWLDVLLWGTTRHRVVFGPMDEESGGGLGLETFEFMRTPPSREFGNMVWVQGAASAGVGAGAGAMAPATTSESPTTTTGRAGGGAREGRTWWTLLGRFFGGGETGAADEDEDEEEQPSGGRSQPRFHRARLGFDKRVTGILERPDRHDTYRSGHVKQHAADPRVPHGFLLCDSKALARASRGDRALERLGGIAVMKEAEVTVVRADRSDFVGFRFTDSS